MSIERKERLRTQRRKLRVRKRLKQDDGLPRVSVHRSLKHISAQVIDDKAGLTLASCSSLELENLKGDKKQIAHAVGLELARRAHDKGIKAVVFDRGSCLYHGRVRSLADALREGGIAL